MRRKFGLSNMVLNRTEEDNLTFFLLTLIVQVFNCQETTLLSVLYIFPLFFLLYVLKYYVLRGVVRLLQTKHLRRSNLRQ